MNKISGLLVGWGLLVLLLYLVVKISENCIFATTDKMKLHNVHFRFQAMEDEDVVVVDLGEEEVPMSSPPTPDPMAGIGYWASPGNSPKPTRKFAFNDGDDEDLKDDEDFAHQRSRSGKNSGFTQDVRKQFSSNFGTDLETQQHFLSWTNNSWNNGITWGRQGVATR